MKNIKNNAEGTMFDDLHQASIAERIKSEIKAKGMKQNFIAEKAKINPHTLQRFFKTGTIGLDNLEKICDVLELQILIQKKGIL
jgi:DNA-binding Xre family transcriptional regulator